MELLELCKWRYATKKMDPKRVVPEDKLQHILETIRLAPTSSGLQPFHVLVISNPQLRAEIKSLAKDQSQIADCSHLLVFAAWDNYTPERITAMYEQHNLDRGEVTERWQAYYQMLLGKYPPRRAEDNFQHCARQVYVALAFAVMAAANEGVDCTPMEGFDPDALDKLLDLRQQGLRSVVMLPLGYRDETNDWLFSLNKSRRPFEQLFSRVD